jgi:hypothetical protein
VLEQVPFGLEISPLPDEIDSWSTCLLWNQPLREQWSKEPMRSKLALGLGLNAIYFPLESKMMPTSTISQELKNTKFLEPLQTPSDWVDMVLNRL